MCLTEWKNSEITRFLHALNRCSGDNICSTHLFITRSPVTMANPNWVSRQWLINYSKHIIIMENVTVVASNKIVMPTSIESLNLLICNVSDVYV